MRIVRIGEVMIEHGLLSREQVEVILREQQTLRRPFGELAERLFGVSDKAVERAWAHQYAHLTEHIDPRKEPIDAEVLALVDRRQAWQFRVLPIRRDGREVMIATVLEHLPRALRFAMRQFRAPCYFVLAKPVALGEALVKHYPMGGMTPDAILAGPPELREGAP